MKILAIESSCDETAAAVVEDGVKILSNVVASSAEMNKKWGGVVPEVAAREQLKSIIPVLSESLSPFTSVFSPHNAYKSVIEKHIDAIAITVGPGLIGSLLMGVESAKTIAMITEKPIIPVNHVLAHMYANFIDNQPTFPAISLVVSGGHTELFLMQSPKKLKWLGGTIDDAAGEAFDKTARLLGFGSGGGVTIQEKAKELRMKNYELRLPRPLIHEDALNFSFSGLKTAIQREWKKEHHESVEVFAHEVQEAITDVLVAKTTKAAEKYDVKSILISGGVAANLKLREKFSNHDSRFTIYAPPIQLCTDNAVSIASCAHFRGSPADWHTIQADPGLSVEVYTL